MVDFLASIKNSVKRNEEPVEIDNPSFRLHYRTTCRILILCFLLVTCQQYFGDPINCTSNSVNTNMDTFCWTHSTYTAPKTDSNSNWIGYEEKLASQNHYHPKHQWTWCVLLIQALIFYIPHWFWSRVESGIVQALTSGLRNSQPLTEYRKIEKIGMILNYFKRKRDFLPTYYFWGVLCQILNFVNITVQIFIMDSFFEHEFSTYGFEVLKFTLSNPYERTDAMTRAFPTVTSCKMTLFEGNSTVISHDALCVLPINVFNERVYIFLWFWFIPVAAVTAINIVIHFAIGCFPIIRLTLWKALTNRSSTSADNIRVVVKNYDRADLYLLDLLSKNMNPTIFGEVLDELAHCIDHSKRFIIDRKA